MTNQTGPRLFSDSTWIALWLKAGLVGAAIIASIFGVYELIERLWLSGSLSQAALYRLHALRGAGTAVLVGAWILFATWRTRQKADQALTQAFTALEEGMRERTRALERTQSFAERILEALQDRLILIDENGRVVKANRRAREAVQGDPIGMPCTMLGAACSPCARDCVAQEALQTGLPVVGRHELTDPRTGRIYAIDAYPVPDPEGRTRLVLESARDVTRARQMETQMRHHEKMAALGVLSAGIAHDIGNPLASMSAELEMLENRPVSDDVRARFGHMRAQLGRMTRTLREMTDFARRRGEEAGPVSIEAAVSDALRMVQHDLRARRVRIETEVQPGLPTLWLVEDHLVMVLVNLAINSFDAMPDGGKLQLRASAHDGGVRVTVRDSGHGMPEEVRRRVGEPLFTTKAGRGTGLGLAVCHDVMRSAGGKLSIESAPGEGTAVHLDFPAAEVARA